jgi:superfamily II DNA or RNA helicase
LGGGGVIRDYEEFLSSKVVKHEGAGIDADVSAYDLKPFQAHITRWALSKGKAAVWADTGLGKTRIQLAFGNEAVRATGKPFLILCPLAVAAQTVIEAGEIGVSAVRAFSAEDVTEARIYVANYDRLKDFDASVFGGVALDESSILKSFMGATKQLLCELFKETPFRLALTATPAPNDHTELGNHAEFLGVMSVQAMLARWFVHDSMNTSEWRLKGHAVEEFWRWVASWAIAIRKPSDLGDSDEGYILPPLTIERHTVETVTPDDRLFADAALSATELHKEMRRTAAGRADKVAELVAAEPDEQWLIWCNTDYEATEIMARINAVEVAGPMPTKIKEDRLLGFAAGTVQVLVTKPKIAGFGMNWQSCSRMAFVGLSYSYEAMYQAIRRCYRFGQQRPVTAHIVTAESEWSVLESIERKQEQHETLVSEMVRLMGQGGTTAASLNSASADAEGKTWRLLAGDCIQRIKDVETESVDYSVFSPPFASLYTYTDMPEDMGNCTGEGEFFEHFEHLVPELLRVLKPGRLLSMHCMQLPMSKERDGVIGLKDFRGDLIRLFQKHGWIYHSEVCIWKDPVVAMQRTKAIGLLYKQLKKDSAMSRQGIADYVVTLRKPGSNPDPVEKTPDGFPVDKWQRYASPVWMDIDQGKVLPYRGARTEKDERHICPLQLDVIERCVELWSNEGDTVLSPFAGIGSEGYMSVRMGRRFVGIELKESYFNQAVNNLTDAEDVGFGQLSLMEEIAA